MAMTALDYQETATDAIQHAELLLAYLQVTAAFARDYPNALDAVHWFILFQVADHLAEGLNDRLT